MEKYLSDKTLASQMEVSRATIWRWVKEGKLPSPVKINRCTRWSEREVQEWITAKCEVSQ